MNDLEQYFYKNKDRLIDKWSHYFDIYMISISVNIEIKRL